MLRSTAFFAALLPFALCSLAACGSDNSSDGSGSGSCTTPVTVKSSFPAANATDAYWRGPFQFELSAADTTAHVTADFAGTQSTLSSGKVVVFTPTTPLVPKSMHTMTLAFCGGTKEVKFTVSDYGTALAAGTALQGKTYSVTISGAHYSVGAGLGSLIDPLYPTPLLVNVFKIEGTKISLRSALSKAGTNPPTQDFCSRTVDYPNGEFGASPYFVFGPTNISFTGSAGSFNVFNLKVEGTASADGSSLSGASFSGTVDAEEVAGPLGLTPAQACQTVGNLGSPCGACPTGSKMTCISLLIDRLAGSAVAGAVEDIQMSSSVNLEVTNVMGTAVSRLSGQVSLLHKELGKFVVQSQTVSAEESPTTVIQA